MALMNFAQEKRSTTSPDTVMIQTKTDNQSMPSPTIENKIPALSEPEDLSADASNETIPEEIVESDSSQLDHFERTNSSKDRNHAGEDLPSYVPDEAPPEMIPDDNYE